MNENEDLGLVIIRSVMWGLVFLVFSFVGIQLFLRWGIAMGLGR